MAEALALQKPAPRGRYVAHRKQAKVLRSRAKITLAVGGIRGGKTDVGSVWMLLKNALQRPCTDDEYHFIFSPTYRMSKAPVDKMFRALSPSAGIFPVSPLIRFARADRIFYLAAKGGVSRVMVMSLEHYDRVRGFRALSGWMDEGAYIKDEAFDVVYGRLADTNGPLLVTTTPNGHNWVFDEYEKAVKEAEAGVPLEKRKYAVAHWTSFDNPYVSAEGMKDLAVQYDEKTFNQEVLALFVRSSGLMYSAFSAANVVDGIRVNPALELWVGQDFNVDPMSSVIAQPFTTREGMEGAIVVAERVARDSNTYELVAFMDGYIRDHRIPRERVTIYVDASGKSRKTSATKSDVQILRAAGYRVSAKSRNPAVKDRVNCVNGLFRPRLLRYPRLLVSRDCVQTIDCLEKQKWKQGVNPPEPDKSTGHDHLPDGLGYLCWGRWPVKPEATLG